MELTESFNYEGWNIKFAIHGPETAAVPIVFVHGTPWSSVVFGPIVNALLSTKRNRILLYDLPGYGKSQGYQNSQVSKPNDGNFQGDTSVNFQSKALTALLKHLKLSGLEDQPAPAVIAHDIAGAIALRTHLIHGCKFRSLLLLDTNAVLPWGDGFYKLVRSEPKTFLQLPQGIFDSMVRAVIRSACFNPQKLQSGWEDLLAESWLQTAKEDSSKAEEKQSSFVRQIAQANDSDVAEMLDENMYSQVSCPVKIIWGEDDKWIPREKMDSLAEKLKHCLKEFVVVPEAGHLVMIDQPERVALEISSWFAEHDEACVQ